VADDLRLLDVERLRSTFIRLRDFRANPDWGSCTGKTATEVNGVGADIMETGCNVHFIQDSTALKAGWTTDELDFRPSVSFSGQHRELPADAFAGIHHRCQVR
jgi:hypothetical protein